MKPLSRWITAFSLALLLIGFQTAGEAWSARIRLVTQDEKAVVKVVKRIDPAVVSVVVTKDIPVLERSLLRQGSGFFTVETKEVGSKSEVVSGGTAFFIRPEGLLITNQHVVSDGDASYSILTNRGNSYLVDVLARDSKYDLALLKVRTPNEQFSIVPFSKSDQVNLGQTVIAFGNALGEFTNTISKGIISGEGRSVSDNLGRTHTDVLQTDAAINSGSSGGPLVNTRGELIGVNFSIISSAQSIAFAVPVSAVKRMLEAYYSAYPQ